MKIKIILDRFYRDERGAAFVLVSIMMVVLLGFSAFVVDAGSLYLEKSRLQKAADAAVLAAAHKIYEDDEQAITDAVEIIGKNRVPINPNGSTTTSSGTTKFTSENDHYRVEITIDSNIIEAKIIENKELLFARFLGFAETDVSASAKAKTGALYSGAGISPIAVLASAVKEDGSKVTLNYTPGQGNSGNYCYLDLDSNGAQGLADSIRNGGNLSIDDTVATTETGMMWGPVKAAIEYRIEHDPIIIVPLIESFEIDGKAEVKIVGFAAYQLTSISGHKIEGNFLTYLTPGELGIGENYGAYTVRLIQ